VRCAFCHDALEGGDAESVTCPGCRTVLHWDCRALLARCPTLGCADASTFVGADRQAVVRPAFRAALARLAAREPPTIPDPAYLENRLTAIRAARVFAEESAVEPRPLPVVDANAYVVCAICKWRIHDVEYDSWRCTQCGTFAHRECRTWFLGSCPREGCSGTYLAPPREGEGYSQERFRRALDSLKKRKPRSE
jgi:hypothetical protein